MKRRVRPIADPPDQTMLDRIDVAILNMPSIIGLVADQMLPKSALPDATFAACKADRTELFLLWKRFGEASFDQAPAKRKIRIARRQCPYRMEMIRQHDNGVDLKRVLLTHRRDCAPQSFDVISQQRLTSVQEINGEKPASARNERATIIWHGATVASAQYASLLRPTGSDVASAKRAGLSARPLQ
jgi:hypothetical protein